MKVGGYIITKGLYTGLSQSKHT